MTGVSTACRARHLSRETETAYRHWVRRYLEFHNDDPARAAVPQGVVAFLNDLVVHRHMSASSHLLALNALLFLFRQVLGQEVGRLEGLRRMRRPQRLPVVLPFVMMSAPLGKVAWAGCKLESASNMTAKV